MADRETEAALGAVALFAELPEPELARVATASRVRHYPRGQVIFTRGDPGDALLVLVSGRIKVLVQSPDGDRLTLHILHPGEVLGELSIVDGGSRSTDAETLDECRLVIVPRAVVLDLMSRFPATSQALLRSVAASLRRLSDVTADLVFLDLPRRVAKYLLDQPVEPDGTLELGMSQEELAQVVGGTRQSVNAALRGFERRSWISTSGRHVRLVDSRALARFAGEEVSRS